MAEAEFQYCNKKPCKPKQKQRFRYLVVVDFEATMKSDTITSNDREIIEFPAVLIDVRTCTVVDEFHKFVKPVLHPNLSSEVTQLTGNFSHKSFLKE